MERIILKIGKVVVNSEPIDLRQPVEFVGKRLARRCIRDNEEIRGYESLYRLEGGRYLIYVEEIEEDESYYRIRIAQPGDLDVGGRYELLAREAGVLTRPMTLDEALKTHWVV